jgi:hypothetical protein
MELTINDVVYDEADMDTDLKHSIVQLQQAKKNIDLLQADLLNQRIILQHHSKYIEDNLPDVKDTSTDTFDFEEDEK